VGSNYLKNLVLERSPKTKPENICVIPTCVDYDKYTPKLNFFQDGIVRFGWIGGDYNLNLLSAILPTLNELASKIAVELIIIAGRNPEFTAEFPIRFYSWSLTHEVELLRKIDIGLMPIEDTLRGRGKCGFKLIQYMGIGIPAIAEAVGANTEIIEHGNNGWLVSKDNWLEILQKASSSKNFMEIAQNALKSIDKNYSFRVNVKKYIHFINENQ
jgi:glycosyltransferase involved in cell wall biosynthesis